MTARREAFGVLPGPCKQEALYSRQGHMGGGRGNEAKTWAPAFIAVSMGKAQTAGEAA